MTTTPYTDTSTGATADSPSDVGAQEKAQHAADAVGGQAQQVGGVAKDEAKQVVDEAKQHARGLLDDAMGQVDDQSRTQLARLSGMLRDVGGDLDDMATGSDRDGVARTLAQEVATRARTLGEHLDGREPRDLLDDVRDYARRRPGTFLLGAVVAGVVAGRLTRGARAATSDDPGTASTSPAPQHPVTPITPVTETPVSYGDPTTGLHDLDGTR